MEAEMNHKFLIAMAVASIAILPGCATKKHVRTEVTRIDSEIKTIETAVEANETRIKEHDSVIAQHGEQLGQLSKEAQEALQRAQSAEKLAKGKLLYQVTLTDDKVHFKFNQGDLPDAAREILDNLISQLKADNRNVYVEIQGHTDSVGDEDYNMKLGEARAESVRRYLAENGIPVHRISTISYGEGRPIASNKTSQGRSENRRVVIQVLE
jgi:outer membrane protein OmpA-like peptidoglycan-associated protein